VESQGQPIFFSIAKPLDPIGISKDNGCPNIYPSLQTRAFDGRKLWNSNIRTRLKELVFITSPRNPRDSISDPTATLEAGSIASTGQHQNPCSIFR
jgi:hypothetical protein